MKQKKMLFKMLFQIVVCLKINSFHNIIIAIIVYYFEMFWLNNLSSRCDY